MPLSSRDEIREAGERAHRLAARHLDSSAATGQSPLPAAGASTGAFLDPSRSPGMPIPGRKRPQPSLSATSSASRSPTAAHKRGAGSAEPSIGPSWDLPGRPAGSRRTPTPAAGEERIDESACRKLLAELASAALLGYVVPAPYGGHGPGVAVGPLVAIREELAYASGLLDLMFVMQGLGSYPISLAGSVAQKQSFLPAVATGRAVAAFAVTEPDAGSDVAAITTLARRDGPDYILDGVKTFISNAPFADLFTVIARTDSQVASGGASLRSRHGLGAFIVEANAPGIARRADIDLIAPHPIGTLVFSGCRVPAKQRLGEEGEGFSIAMGTLDRFRSTVGAAAVGFARRALDEALRFAKSRIQFGRPIAEFEGIQFKLADMATRLEAARLLVQSAAASADRASDGAFASGDAASSPRRSPRSGTSPAEANSSGESAAEDRPYPISPLKEDPSRAASMAKLFATEAAHEIVDEAVQIHGGRGLVRGNIVESLYREVRALRIYEGTSEIQRSLIARSLIR